MITTAIATVLTYITVAFLKGRKPPALTAEEKTARKLAVRLLAAGGSVAFIIITALLTGEELDVNSLGNAFALFVEVAIAFLATQGIYLVSKK